MEVKEAFSEWVKKDDVTDEVKNHDFFGSKVLVRVFLYNPPKKEGSLIIGSNTAELLGSAGKNVDGTELNAKARILPFVKVLKVGSNVTSPYDTLKPGDIVTVSDVITEVRLNPAYEHWIKQGGKEARPKITTPEPPKHISGLETWREFQFQVDKFKEEYDKEDRLTFLIPQSYIISKIEA